MSDRQRIVDIILDEKTVVRRKPEVEHERAVAIFDLIESNSFTPAGHDEGPVSSGDCELALLVGLGAWGRAGTDVGGHVSSSPA